jgi:hypothetical protein
MVAERNDGLLDVDTDNAVDKEASDVAAMMAAGQLALRNMSDRNRNTLGISAIEAIKRGSDKLLADPSYL